MSSGQHHQLHAKHRSGVSSAYINPSHDDQPEALEANGLSIHITVSKTWRALSAITPVSRRGCGRSHQVVVSMFTEHVNSQSLFLSVLRGQSRRGRQHRGRDRTGTQRNQVGAACCNQTQLGPEARQTLNSASMLLGRALPWRAS